VASSTRAFVDPMLAAVCILIFVGRSVVWFVLGGTSMKRNMIRLTLGLAAMCVVVMGLESQADARLFGRGGRGGFGGGRHHGCGHHQSSCCEQQTSCCEAPVQEVQCCEQSHDCGCQSDCGCGHGRRHHRRHRHGGGGCGCDSGCDSGGGCGCNGGGGGEVIYEDGQGPSNNGGPAPAAPEAPAESNGQQEAPSA
jgi:hypothetical protein